MMRLTGEGFMMMNFRMVPKMISPDTCDIYIVLSNGDSRQIARVLFPHDGQMNDNLECAETVCIALKKRVKKSV